MSYSALSKDLPGASIKYYVFGSGSPSVLITAGLHGDEVTSIYGAWKLTALLKGLNVKGRVTVVPVVNVLGFNAGTRTNPVDGVDLNRVFPEGCGSSTTVEAVKFIWGLAEEADYVIDLHCAGLHSYPYILSLYREFSHVWSFVKLMPWDVAVESTGLRGQLFVEASREGVPAAIFESVGGSGLFVREWVTKLDEFLLETLRRLGVVEGVRNSLNVYPEFYGKIEEVPAGREGFFEACKDPGRKVSLGECLGNIWGEEVRSPLTGRLLWVAEGLFLSPYSTAARIAPPIRR